MNRRERLTYPPSFISRKRIIHWLPSVILSNTMVNTNARRVPVHMNLDTVVLGKHDTKFLIRSICKLGCARRISSRTFILMSKTNNKVCGVGPTFFPGNNFKLLNRPNGIGTTICS